MQITGQTVSGVFRLRWILWSLAPLIGLCFLPGIQSKIPFLTEAKRVRFDQVLARHFKKTLFFCCLGFFVLAVLAKESQYWSLALSGQDFWLFEDMLRQLAAGAAFLTRFAPQEAGWVQHGVIHVFFTWIGVVPLSWLLGPVQASLVFMPMLISAAGFVLGILCRSRWSASSALVLALLFLNSSQIGRVLTYETHPEAAYPFFVFLWLWAFGINTGKVRPIALLLATLGGMGIKEDAFLVFLPLISMMLIFSRGKQRLAALMSLFGAIGMVTFQFHAIHEWKTQAWGPLVWRGSQVRVPAGPTFLKGIPWDSFGSALRIVTSLIDQEGGIIGTIRTVLTFFVSKPWLSLLVFAPWVVLDWTFWVIVTPLATVVAILGGSIASFVNYYSAPFLGLFWAWAVIPLRNKLVQGHRFKLYWMVFSVLLFGGSGLCFYFPSPLTQELKREAELLKPCLDRSSKPGLVATQLIGLVPEEKVWTEREPARLEDWSQIGFVALIPQLGSFELPLERGHKILTQLANDPKWVRCGETQEIVFYRRVSD